MAEMSRNGFMAIPSKGFLNHSRRREKWRMGLLTWLRYDGRSASLMYRFPNQRREFLNIARREFLRIAGLAAAGSGLRAQEPKSFLAPVAPQDVAKTDFTLEIAPVTVELAPN